MRVPWQDAVQESADGVRLLLDVTPGARRPAFPAGFDPWRGRIGIRVRAAAQDGAANDEVVARVARALRVAPGAVRIVAGASGRRKAVGVHGLSRTEALGWLGEAGL